ncbi:hypothetical protein CHS0354_007330 [Potamilus streckersoni]|uniref:EF-hand domain-containing protein n=1 Tax=Potamilus streckersoni TaxID=2493646 RepID=A0AAE0TGG5_9BIVA|nr:hypothetical protein CHS0354_007330 [Potamilus streckersoni]
MPPNRMGPTDLLDADISFPLNRLFDPLNMDEVPEDDRMKKFKHRDLAHVKHYKAAVRIFGGPLSRKRVIIAPPMETPMKHRLGMYMNLKPTPESPVLTTALKPQIQQEKPPPEELVVAQREREREDSYKQWMQARQKFRNDLDNMGLSEQWLEKKPNKTALEKRVLMKLRQTKKEQKEQEKDAVFAAASESGEKSSSSDHAETTSVSTTSSKFPDIRLPTPLGVRTLEKHLKMKKKRLVDLFTEVDKDKKWKISKEDFQAIMRKENIPLTDMMLEEIILVLDMNLDNKLDYKELARGLEQWKKEKREEKRKELSREGTPTSPLMGEQDTELVWPTKISRDNSKMSAKSAEQSQFREQSPKQAGMVPKSPRSIDPSGDKFQGHASKQRASKTDTTGATSENLTISRESSQILELPEMDLRPERMVFDNEEAMLDLRKRDREALKGGYSKTTHFKQDDLEMIKIGDKAIDNHCQPSTLGGEVGELVNKSRQQRLKEYHEVCQLCEENGVVLSKHLLNRVLLYPPDIQHEDLRKRGLRPPEAAPLVSSHFADPPKRPKTPIEVKHKDKVRRSRSGRLLIDSRHKYPANRSVAPVGHRVTLSTGKAVIKRKVDCWMPFEEYERLTRHLAIRYQHLHGTTDKNAFWPGVFLDKLRLCMPPYDKEHLRDKENSIFIKAHRTKASNYGYESISHWTVNDSGYLQTGIYDPYARKTIH